MTFSDDLRSLAVAFDQVPAQSVPLIRKAVGISALKGKREWQRAASSHRYLGAYVPSIDYDPVENLTTELGPNLDRGVGAPGLGIVEDSPGGVKGTPQRNYLRAEKAIEDDLEQGVQIAIDQTLRKLGL